MSVEIGVPISLCWGPINYCQYNIVEPRTLILCPGLVFCVST
ncbi:hypothetical protein HMPREF0774_2346 [Staphylococcus aureus subsp. aureus TCH130]|nr:hypothetical protein HMPREF0776_0183 [Staphylococcus aureus subsp. aureus USA300_TCH959]EES95781.1 hypothetical protein HMPREF0774_2346 [Staphylococcus aureus subsp. aureus TCH130]